MKHYIAATPEPTYHGYTPYPECTQYLGFVDPEHFIENNYAPGKTCDAVDNKIITEKNTQVITEDVLANDTATTSDITLTQVDSHSVKGASLGNNGDGTFIYTPPVDFVGADSFTYTIADNKGCTDTATVYIEVKKPSTDSNSGGNGGGSFSLYGLMGFFFLLFARLFRKIKK